MCRGCFRDILRRSEEELMMQQVHDKALPSVASLPLPAEPERASGPVLQSGRRSTITQIIVSLDLWRVCIHGDIVIMYKARHVHVNGQAL